MTTNDYLFRGDLEELDPEVAELIRHETARQGRYLIMIPSESTVPQAVRDAIGSSFHNIYAEGYPLEETRWMTQQEIIAYEERLPEYRRQADNRYYKGTEYANIVESLARRRCAEVFANEYFTPDQLYVNVQPLSGAPANNAVYTALLNVGDTVMGMDLIMGGHLTHGSPVNRSGKFFNIVSYTINPETEQLDYDQMLRLAQEHQPKMIIGGYSSYPMQPDWHKYREIADSVGAYFMADVAHVAGMIAAGVYPSPVGIADVVTFTTHKTLNGPRGAVVITHRKDLSSKIDRGVFPGEQGGPHVNSMAGLAVALRFATTDQFKKLQQQTVINAKRLADKLIERGLHLPHGGTNTHLMVVDCKSIVGPDGTTLSGDMAARVLDLVGIVANRQTIPGDTSALRPNGVRLGTPWITQRGFHEAEIDELGDIIADVLQACVPFSLTGRVRPLARTKVDFDVFQNAKMRVRDLTDRIGIDTDVKADGYPHFYYLDDYADNNSSQTFSITGEVASEFLQVAVTSDVALLQDGEQQATNILEVDGSLMTTAVLEKVNRAEYLLHITENVSRAATWLRALSDGFVLFDHTDIAAKLPGPVAVMWVKETSTTDLKIQPDEQAGYSEKAYFIGINGEKFAGTKDKALPAFEIAPGTETEHDPLLATPLHPIHIEKNAKMGAFAGYDMPLWYSSVMDEHISVRTDAGVFDVTHMGVFEVKGVGATTFLQAVTTNDVDRLSIGTSHYTFLLNPEGIPFDDLLIYRVSMDHYLMVVNASNNDVNWAWLNAVKNGAVMIDPSDSTRKLSGRDTFTLRDLRDPNSGDDQRVDIALQGPNSQHILLNLSGTDDDKRRVRQLTWAGITKVELGGYDLYVSRTGYTGERVAYELLVHPDNAAKLFTELIELGATPCGLAARDSLRIEAGLPLYGHELNGPLKLNPADAGMGSYVKLYKPFFIGKSAFIAHEQTRDAQISRFRLDSKGARPAHQGDPIVDARGRVVGVVTSCSVDSDGYQLGQAYLKKDYRKADTQLAVFAGSARAKVSNLAQLGLGDKAPMPEPLTILSRFPKRKKK